MMSTASPSSLIPPDWTALLRDVEECMLADRHRLRMQVTRLRRNMKDKSAPRDLARIRETIARSRRIAKQRADNLPVPEYPENLPVSERRDEIADAIRKHPVVIVAGETGSGKTTQLPKICLELGRGIHGMIGCTQPRRIAAISVAGRVASELQSPVGDTVGYQIRFDARVKPESYIKFMTDGILLAETQADRFLNAYDTLIIDEAHERSLNIDFILGYLKNLLPKRPNLKVIISSATLDVERFSGFFDNAPVVNVQGRTYPVKLRYRPPDDEDTDLAVQVGHAVDEILGESDTGDALVFLPGERDIRETADHLERKRLKHIEILPLFGRLSASEQKRVFSPGPARRIVLATNVAETSITVPRIHYVIDAGTARIKRYSHRTQVEHLQIEGVSRASAEQRKGRCGRIAPGVCIRLYSEEEYRDRPEYTDPEIQRSSLASVILQMKALKLGDVETFPFVDPPPRALIKTGYDELFELAAIDEDKRLTHEGRRMARLPIEPRYARMLFTASRHGALEEVLTIVAALSIMDPRERPLEKRDQADSAHARFLDDKSDFLSWLHIRKEFERQRKNLRSGNQLRKWCKDTFLSYRRMREWNDVREQLAGIIADEKIRLNDKPALYEQIHKSLLAGLLCRIGKRTEDEDYQGARDVRFVLWPGSGLKKSTPRWIVAGELVETSRLFARCVGKIEPEWIEELGGSLCKRTYQSPWWDQERGMARAYEQVSLYGVPIVERRRIHYGPIDPETSRMLMIRDGLVRGAFRTRAAFFRHNRELVESLEEMEHKTRQRGLVVDEESLIRFYDERIPADIVTAKALEKWVFKQEKDRPEILRMCEEDVAMEDARGLSTDLFPPRLHVAGATFDLAYRFDPGHEEDGVTCTVPVGVLQQLPAAPFGWIVPGLLPDKVAELLRSLPRRHRRDINPISDTASECLRHVESAQGAQTVDSHVYTPPEASLISALRESLLACSGVRVADEDFRPDELPMHLRMHFRVIDDKGNTVAHGRDLSDLQQTHTVAARQQFVKSPKEKHEQEGLIEWPDERVPERIDLSGGAGRVWGYPALVDETETVSLRIFDSPAKAESEHRAGVLRLILFALDTQVRNTRKSLPLTRDAGLLYAALGGSPDCLKDDILWNAAENVFLNGQSLPRAEASFQARIDAGQTGLYKAAYDLGSSANNILLDTQTLAAMLREQHPPVMRSAVEDITAQLNAMVYPGFIRATPYDQVAEIPRYIVAAATRLQRLQQNLNKDAERLKQLQPYLNRWQEAVKQLHGPAPQALVTYRWMLEEFRVSLFAQEIGTKGKISPKRLDDQWRDVSYQFNIVLADVSRQFPLPSGEG